MQYTSIVGVFCHACFRSVVLVACRFSEHLKYYTECFSTAMFLGTLRNILTHDDQVFSSL